MREIIKSFRRPFKFIEKIIEMEVELEGKNKRIKFLSGLCNNGKMVYLNLSNEDVILKYGLDETEIYRLIKKPLKLQNEVLYKCFITTPYIFKHVISLLVKDLLKK